LELPFNQIKIDAQQFVTQHGPELDTEWLRGPFLITGCSGMLGFYLTAVIDEIAKCLKIDTKIYATSSNALDRKPSLHNFSKNVTFFDYRELDSNLSRIDFRVVLHAASPASISNVIQNIEQLVNRNIVLTIDLLKRCGTLESKMYLFSSGEVYGPMTRYPTGENDFGAIDPLNVRSLYPESKKLAESIAYAFDESVVTNILRIYHTFGPGLRKSDNRIFAEVINSVIDEEPFVLNSDGTATRNFLYSLDLFNAIYLLRFSAKTEAFNIAGDEEFSIREFLDIAKETFSNFKVFEAEKKSEFTSNIKRGSADTSKIKKIGWKQSIGISDALRRTYVWRMETETVRRNHV